MNAAFSTWRHHMRNTLASSATFSPLAFALATALIGGLVAVEPARAAQVSTPPTVQLIQPGDTQKSCEELAAEINAVSAAREQAANRGATTRRMFGFASNAIGAGLGLGGGWGAGVGAAAAGAVADAAADGQVRNAPGVGIEGRRLERLLALHDNKGC